MFNSVSASPLHTKMSLRRAKSPGWAAFDLKQQQKQGLLEVDNEPFPPVSNTVYSLGHCQNLFKNDDNQVTSFSSVLITSRNSPTLIASKDLEKQLQVGNCSGNWSNKILEENVESKVVKADEKLKKLQSWAENSFLVDIMTCVNNDIDKTSTLLEAMVYSEENGEANIANMKSNDEETPLDNIPLPGTKYVFSGEATNPEELRYVVKDCLNNNRKKLIADHSSSQNMLPTDAVMKADLGNLRFVPVEPEWEVDDIYFIHRKDALKMARSASRHSKASRDAYMIGDHLSAQQFSLKAQEEWKAVERLNAKAAKEILSIRNFENDVWKLDLHGLHAMEAVQALRDHLQMIESQVPLSRFVSPKRDDAKSGFPHSASLKSLSHMDVQKLDKQEASYRHRPASLEVITGRGNHCQGQATLPAAIRSFLSENRYHYDEARPGVITVRPKFQRQ